MPGVHFCGLTSTVETVMVGIGKCAKNCAIILSRKKLNQINPPQTASDQQEDKSPDNEPKHRTLPRCGNLTVHDFIRLALKRGLLYRPDGKVKSSGSDHDPRVDCRCPSSKRARKE